MDNDRIETAEAIADDPEHILWSWILAKAEADALNPEPPLLKFGPGGDYILNIFAEDLQ